MTVPHYGKRNAGALTAASPGDTLFFNFASYNDSGDSEALTGLTVADIEVFKNGLATARATDSGYSLISDTGQIGDRVGLYRFSVQLFNTADDANFYASGSWYQVAVDAVTIDGKTVRFWAGSFEIGVDPVNVVQIDGDTGSADVLAKATNGVGGVSFAAGINMNSSSDTGLNQRLSQIQADVDTGLANSDILRVRGDTGAGQRLFRFLEKLDTGGDLSVPQAAVDTGVVNQAVWQANAARSITASSDTGINDRLAKILADTDTGIQSSVNVTQIRGDTGGADRFYRYTQKLDTGGDATVSASVDTGQVNNAVWNGARSAHTGAGTFGQYVTADADLLNGDTGFAAQLGKFASVLSDAGLIDTGTGAADTGVVNNTIWNGSRAAHITAGTFGQYVHSNLVAVLTDTGAAHLSGGRLGVTATASIDTGQVNQAVWQANAARGITAIADTGMNERFGRIQSDVDTGLRTHINDLDTGLHDTLSDYDTGVRGILITTGVNLGRIRGDTGAADRFFRYTQKLDTGGDATVSASVDTGLVNQAVWQANAQRKLTVDTGIADQVWMQTKASYTTDTGTFGEHLGGTLGGAASVDTGQINQAVWQGNATRSITASSDTGLNDRLAKIQADVDTGLQNADLLRVRGDTGAAQRFLRFLEKLDTGGDLSVTASSSVDTGQVSNAVWNSLRSAHTAAGSFGETDTGFNQRFGQIQSDVDTGLRAQISDVDTGLHDTIADLDTGVRALLALRDTGAIASAVWGFSSRPVTNVTGISDTGVNQRLGAIQTKTDSLTFTVAGVVDSNIQRVNDVNITGTGDTGTADTWRPA